MSFASGPAFVGPDVESFRERARHRGRAVHWPLKLSGAVMAIISSAYAAQEASQETNSAEGGAEHAGAAGSLAHGGAQKARVSAVRHIEFRAAAGLARVDFRRAVFADVAPRLAARRHDLEHARDQDRRGSSTPRASRRRRPKPPTPKTTPRCEPRRKRRRPSAARLSRKSRRKSARCVRPRKGNSPRKSRPPRRASPPKRLGR